MSRYVQDKKVLLCERKRHTAHRVVSTPSVVLTDHPDLAGGEGVPCQGVPYLGTPPSWPGGTLLGVPTWVHPPSWPQGGTLPGVWYPTWVPPSRVLPSWPRGYPAGGTLLGGPYLGTPHPGPGGSLPGGCTLPGVPYQGVPCQGYPTWVPPDRVPPSWPGRVPPPPSGPGWVPPQCLPHGILGNVAKHYGIWVPPWCLPHGILDNVTKHYGIWVPPMDRQKDRHMSKHYLPVVLRTRAVKIKLRMASLEEWEPLAIDDKMTS